MQQWYEDGHGKDVDVGLPADLIDRAIEFRLQYEPTCRASADGKDEPGEPRQLEQRNRDARAEDEDRQGPQAGTHELADAVDDAMGYAVAHLKHRAHREHVGRYVQRK